MSDNTTITLTPLQVAVLRRSLGYGSAATSQAEIKSGVHQVVQDGIQAIRTMLPDIDVEKTISDAAEAPEANPLSDIANEVAQRVKDGKPK